MLSPFAWRPVLVVATIVAGVLTAFGSRYGFHRDELYFVVAGQHPAAGYVDQPPLTPLLARAATLVFGETPAGLRVVATAATVGTVLLVALAARELRGGRAAQLLAATCAGTATFVIVVGHMVSTATFDLLIWVALCVLTLRALRTGDGRWWLAVGAVAGIGLLNKYLVLLLVAGLAVGVLVAGPRRVLRSWWLPAGIGVALLITAPNLVWQATHGWPQLTVAAGISADDGAENRALFVPLQLVYLSPAFVPIWVAGLVRLFRDETLRWARPVALAYPVVCAVTLVLGGKSYYALPLQLVLLAAGAAPVAGWLARGRLAAKRALAAFAVVVSLAGTAGLGLPVLPPSALDDPGVLTVNAEPGEQVGWLQLVATVASGWERIPEDQRDDAVIIANYGEAGAIWVYGPEHGLPRPYSGHMSFADWRRPPDSATGPVLVVHPKDASAGRSFVGCAPVAVNDVPGGAENEERGAVVELCQRPATHWSRLWPTLRHYY